MKALNYRIDRYVCVAPGTICAAIERVAASPMVSRLTLNDYAVKYDFCVIIVAKSRVGFFVASLPVASYEEFIQF